MSNPIKQLIISDLKPGDVLFWVPCCRDEVGWRNIRPLILEITKRGKSRLPIAVFDAVVGTKLPDKEMPFPMSCYWLHGYEAGNVSICSDPPINVQRTFADAIRGAVQANNGSIDALQSDIDEHAQANERLLDMLGAIEENEANGGQP